MYEIVEELDLPEVNGQHILIDELIKLTGKKAVDLKLHTQSLQRIVAYHEEKNTTIEIITNDLTWQASTIAAIYKRRWDIEIFFKQLKQNLNVKTFVSNSPNCVKSQIFVALITYLLLELLRRVKAKGKTAFSNFGEKIRICLCYYLTLDYVIIRIQPKARSVRVKQSEIEFEKKNTLF